MANLERFHNVWNLFLRKSDWQLILRQLQRIGSGGFSVPIESEWGFQVLVLTHFLHANRRPFA
jgi:hypothetical protein